MWREAGVGARGWEHNDFIIQLISTRRFLLVSIFSDSMIVIVNQENQDRLPSPGSILNICGSCICAIFDGYGSLFVHHLDLATHTPSLLPTLDRQSAILLPLSHCLKSSA